MTLLIKLSLLLAVLQSSANPPPSSSETFNLSSSATTTFACLVTRLTSCAPSGRYNRPKAGRKNSAQCRRRSSPGEKRITEYQSIKPHEPEFRLCVCGSLTLGLAHHWPGLAILWVREGCTIQHVRFPFGRRNK